VGLIGGGGIIELHDCLSGDGVGVFGVLVGL
jgi:hypothetical protein